MVAGPIPPTKQSQFKITLETMAAKADQNGETAQLMAMGKKLVTTLESAG